MIGGQAHDERLSRGGARDARSSERHVPTDELFRTYASFVARLLTRMGVRRDELDDAVQEVFLTAHKNGGYAPGAAKPTTYLARIALNTALSERRRARRRWSRFSERAPDELESGHCDPGRVLETQEALGQVDRALERLNPTLRATLWLADAEGESCVAIAEASEVPVGTVYWRLDRARKQFREALRKSDSQTAPRRALGVFALWGGVESDAGDGLARHARELLAWAGKAALPAYDVARGLARLRLGLASAAVPAASVTFASALGGTKGMAVFGAVCLGLAGLMTLPSYSDFARYRSLPLAHAAAANARGPEPIVALPSSARAPAAARVRDAIDTSVDTPAVVPAHGREASRGRHDAPRSRSRRAASVASAFTSRGETSASERALAWLGAEADEVLADTDARVAPEPPRASEPPAEPARPAEPAPRVQASPSEARQVALAVRLLETKPAAALSVVRALPVHADGSFLREEREYVEVMALYALDQHDEAARRADAFLRAHPVSALGRAIRKAVVR